MASWPAVEGYSAENIGVNSGSFQWDVISRCWINMRSASVPSEVGENSIVRSVYVLFTTSIISAFISSSLNRDSSFQGSRRTA